MRFSVFYLTSVPDVEIGRRLHAAADLDDRAVGKLMFHRRQEETGAQVDLRLVQKRVAAATVIQLRPETVTIRNLDAERNGEEALLRTLFDGVIGNQRVITWDGAGEDWPLLHYRALQHRISAPGYWQERRERPDFQLDLATFLGSGGPHAATSLHELSRVLGLPGMLGLETLDPWETWLTGEPEPLRQRSEIGALNLCLLALRALAMTGELSHNDAARGEVALRAELQAAATDLRRRFLQLWQD